MTPSSLTSVRAITTSRRPPSNHGCPGVKVIPGLWTAHFHDIKTLDALRSIASLVTCWVAQSFFPAVEPLFLDGVPKR